MPALGIVRSIHAIAIQQSWTRFRQIRVPYLIGALAQGDALYLMPATRIKNTQLDFLGVGREDREVDTFAVPSGAEGVRAPGPDPHPATPAGRAGASADDFLSRLVPAGRYEPGLVFGWSDLVWRGIWLAREQAGSATTKH